MTGVPRIPERSRRRMDIAGAAHGFERGKQEGAPFAKGGAVRRAHGGPFHDVPPTPGHGVSSLASFSILPDIARRRYGVRGFSSGSRASRESVREEIPRPPHEECPSSRSATSARMSRTARPQGSSGDGGAAGSVRVPSPGAATPTPTLPLSGRGRTRGPGGGWIAARPSAHMPVPIRRRGARFRHRATDASLLSTSSL